MKTNLLLLVIVLVGGWYLYNMSAPAPVETPVAQPVAKPNYAGARTYYSPLNDPAVSVGTHYGSISGSTAGGSNRSSNLTLGATSSVRGGSSTQSSSYSSSQATGLGLSNGEPTLNLRQRANSLGDAAKGD